ncbi:MAG TPA: BrnT family toxin [Gemmatimonadota bacterium]|nr:BrnT family toxin [Gemmatimonadota bacterium]
MFSFEFDEAKSQVNLTKHGINFIDAQRLWNDPRLLEIPAITADEPRYLVIGLINGKHWSAITTYRGTHVRLISVRRSRTEEVALYES